MKVKSLDQEQKNMFNTIGVIWGRTLMPQERLTILKWLEKYKINPSTVEYAFKLSKQNGVRNLAYTETIIKRLDSNGRGGNMNKHEQLEQMVLEATKMAKTLIVDGEKLSAEEYESLKSQLTELKDSIRQLKGKELTQYNDFETSWDYATGIQREEYFRKTQEYADQGVELTDKERYYILWGEEIEE